MKLRISLLAIAASTLWAQEANTVTFTRSIGLDPIRSEQTLTDSIKGAPYSADAVTENTQVLPDGNRIVNRQTGFVARDSQGRTRNEAGVQMMGSALPGKPVKIVMIHDPVAQVTYTLETGLKTARKVSTGNPEEAMGMKRAAEKAQTATGGKDTTFMITRDGPGMMSREAPGMMGREAGLAMAKEAQFKMAHKSTASLKKESLGTQMIEGVMAEGTRMTETIAAGEIGNEKDIQVVHEVWTAQDLKAVILSKRMDPRMGEMSFRLTNIQRVEPAASLFEVPADYQIVDGPFSKGVFYYKNEE
jgi:hypothetical protein